MINFATNQDIFVKNLLAWALQEQYYETAQILLTFIDCENTFDYFYLITAILTNMTLDGWLTSTRSTLSWVLLGVVLLKYFQNSCP